MGGMSHHRRPGARRPARPRQGPVPRPAEVPRPAPAADGPRWGRCHGRRGGLRLRRRHVADGHLRRGPARALLVVERHRRRRGDPGGDGRPVPRRRVQRAGRARPERGGALRHHRQLRGRLGHGRGSAADDPAEDPRRERRGRLALRRRGRLPVALQPRGRVLDVLRERRGRELPARRAGGGRRRARSSSRASSRRRTTAAGRTSTSRSTPRSTTPRRPATGSAPRRSRCRRTSARRSTRTRTGTTPASRTSSAPRCPRTWCSPTATRCRWRR